MEQRQKCAFGKRNQQLLPAEIKNKIIVSKYLNISSQAFLSNIELQKYYITNKKILLTIKNFLNKIIHVTCRLGSMVEQRFCKP